MKICNDYSTPNFGYRIAVDLGASSPKCTAKCTVFTNKGKKLLEMPTRFLNDTVEGFNNKQDFVEKCAKYIKHISDTITEGIKNKQIQLSGKDKLLAGILFLVPGTTYINPQNNKHNYIAFMPNVRNKQGESLTNISFDELENSLLNSNSDKNINIDKSEFKILASQDLSGTGLALASLLKSRKELNEGDYVMGVVTGGGLGCVDIKVINNQIHITTSESSNYITGNGKLSSQIQGSCETCLKTTLQPFAKLGSVGASVKSCIANFANELNTPELTEILQQVGDARIVTDNIMQISKNEEGLLEKLTNNTFFKQIGETNDKITFSLNPEHFDNKQLQLACISSINSYADAISLLCINKIDESINKVYLLGPLANGLNRYIMENSNNFNNAKNLPELVEQKIMEKIGEDGINLKATRQLKELYNFEIICNPDINIPNNTYGGSLFFDKNFHFTDKRGNWLNIPFEAQRNPLEKYCLSLWKLITKS